MLTGRGAEPLESVARRISASGGRAEVQTGDMMDSARVYAIAAHIERAHGRIDILINNAGLNIQKRSWAELTPEGVDEIVRANLSGAFYASLAVLPAMRRQKDGLLIHTSSWAGRFHSKVSGTVYSAAKHGVVAMSYGINLEEFRHGIQPTISVPATRSKRLPERVKVDTKKFMPKSSAEPPASARVIGTTLRWRRMRNAR